MYNIYLSPSSQVERHSQLPMVLTHCSPAAHALSLAHSSRSRQFPEGPGSNPRPQLSRTQSPVSSSFSPMLHRFFSHLKEPWTNSSRVRTEIQQSSDKESSSPDRIRPSVSTRSLDLGQLSTQQSLDRGQHSTEQSLERDLNYTQQSPDGSQLCSLQSPDGDQTSVKQIPDRGLNTYFCRVVSGSSYSKVQVDASCL